ncbi:MAG: M48 family metallopeptidase [Gemmataceae bacterium]
MAFLLLLFLIGTSLPLPWPESLVGGGLMAGLVAGTASGLVPVLAAFAIAWRTRARLLADPTGREETLYRYHRARGYHFFFTMALYALALGVFGWGWAVRDLFGAETPEELPFGAELVQMVPFLAALVLSWAGFYTAERTAVETARLNVRGGRWSYVAFLARQHLAMTSVPLGLFVVQQGLFRAYPEWGSSPWARAAMLSLVIVFLVVAPWPLRFLLGTRRLPDGPLRDRLVAAARRLGFRYSDILLWHTRRGVANAMVAGPLPWVRYVFLSDRLLDDLTPDEVEAVFGHEVGHVRHGHIPYYMLFMFLSLPVLEGLWAAGVTWAFGPEGSAMAEAWREWGQWNAVPAVALIGAYVFVVFGFLSRRCERQADVFGCRAVSCEQPDCIGHLPDEPLSPGGRGLCPTGIRTFQRALDRVAMVNGISRRKPGWLHAWMHSTIARRVEFLERVIHDPNLERRFQRRLGVLKWALLAALLAASAGLSYAGYY